MGQLNCYIEVLNRNAKEEKEKLSVRLVLYASKDYTVAEYALGRSLS